MGIASVNAPELTKGALSVAFVKNPNDPIWAKDKALALYLKVMKTYDPSGKPSDVYNWYGMTVAWTMVEALKAAGRNPTRASLLRAATHLNLRGNPFLLPGIVIRTTPDPVLPARPGLPLPLEQQAVGQVERAAARVVSSDAMDDVKMHPRRNRQEGKA